MAITILGNLAYGQGDWQQAWKMVRELLPRGPDSDPEGTLFPYAVEVMRLAAKLALDAEDTGSAARWLQAHDRWLDWSGAWRGRAESRLLRGRLQLLRGEIPEAERCGRESLRLASDPRQPLLLLAAYRFLGQVSMCAGRYSDAERQVAMALDLANVCAVPYERALTLLTTAELSVATGQPQDARRLLDEVRGIALRLDAAPLVVLADGLGMDLASATAISDLTSREVEVLRLITEGLTDAEAADRLYISPRTVGQHLRSVYNKLGVSSRTAATRVAIEKHIV